MNKNRKYVLIILCLLSLICLVLTYSRSFRNADLYFSDLMYQNGNIASGKIVLIEIDEQSMEALGSDPLSWDRSVYADLLNVLNTKEVHPAVIGMDVIFAHEQDTGSDEVLAKAASFGNVVTAGMYYYGPKLLTEADGSYIWNDQAVIDEAMPYEGLRKVSDVGIVNLVSDPDGLIRHIRIRYQGEEEKAGSFALQIAERYCRETGRELVLPEGDHAYLEYTYPVGGYREKISMIDVIRGSYPASYFADKIVLIGSCASAMQDEYLTAINRNQAMYGVEVHANSIELLLRGQYQSEVPDSLQRLIQVFLSLFGAWIFSGKRFGQMFLYWIGVLVAWIAACIFGSRSGSLLHPFWITAALSILFVAAVAFRFVEEYASRRKLRDQFEHYVDPVVLKKILDSGSEELRLDGKESEIAVLFVDICGFTSLSEKLKAVQVVDVLNKYLEMVTDCIMRNNGTLDKFIGDCAMAFWNAPFEQEDPVGKALKAGLDMLEGAEALNRELGFDLGFAIGIHCGRAVVGNIGSGKRMDFTAIGDTVNTASRLESLKIEGENREGNIYVSEEVYDVLKDRYQFIDLGEHPLKGKEKAVRIYAYRR